MNKFFGVVFLVLFACLCNAQDFNSDYSPIRNYRPHRQSIADLSTAFKNLKVEEVLIDSKSRKEFKKIFTESGKDLVMMDSMTHLMENDPLTSYLRSIVYRIQQSNPALKDNNYKVFVYKSSEPNAFNIGLGVVCFNLYMLGRVRCEEDIAFILAHEIAHDYSKHVLNSVIKYIATVNNPEFKKKLKKAAGQEYNSVKAVQDIQLSNIAFLNKHGREDESIADSLGLVFYANAGYRLPSAIHAVQFLDSVDQSEFKMVLDLNKHLNLKSFPFKNEWVQYDTSSSTFGGNYVDPVIPDSLKTHPDCSKRAKDIERIIQNYKPASIYSPDVNIFKNVHLSTHFELLEFYKEEKNYGAALFRALQMLEIYPENIYLKTSVSECLAEIYLAQTDHTFSVVVPFPSKDFSKPFNEFLQFLHNLNKSSITGLAMNYYKENVEHYNTPYSNYIGVILKQIPADEKARELVYLGYADQNSNGYYEYKLLHKLRLKAKPKQIQNK